MHLSEIIAKISVKIYKIFISKKILNIFLEKTKKGRRYYGCEGYPDCDFVTWDKPVEKKCPNCNDGTTMFEKKGHYFCAKCGYDEVKPKN